MLFSLLFFLPFGCTGADDSGTQDSVDTATDDTGDTVDTGVENTVPAAPTLYWSNAGPVAGEQAFSCLAEAATDAEGDALSLEVTWTQDGSPYTGATGTDQFAGDTIPADAATKPHLWGCSASWNDGTALSESSSISVQTVAPSCSADEELPLCQGANVDAPPLEGSTAGGVAVGMRLTAGSAMEIQGAEVFTGARSGGSSIEIWSHDAGANAPLEALASGSWSIGEPLEWQGANFDEAVSVAAGEHYWVVWHQLSRAHSSFADESAGGLENLYYRPSTDGGSTWGDLFEGPFRVQVRCCD
jgi:hypothetical protein